MKLPNFMVSDEQAQAAAEVEAVCDSLTDGLDLPPPDGSDDGYDKLPYLPSDPYGGPEQWGPGGSFYWSRCYQAACNADHDSLRILLSQVGTPSIIVNRCIVQVKNTTTHWGKRVADREEVLRCLQMALDTFQ